MQPLKRLVSDTAIYGLTSIVGRVLFFLLTPLYTDTSVLPKTEYGQMTHIFGITAFFLVLFGYGLETAFFRYALKEKNNIKKTYSTALTSILLSTLLFGSLLILFHRPLANLLNASTYSSLVLFMIIIVMLDTLTSIPFAYLRAINRPIRFAAVKLINIGVNIGLNLVFYVLCPFILSNEQSVFYDFVDSWYTLDFGAGYAFLANIIASTTSLILLGKDYFLKWGSFSVSLWKKMLQYGWPILIVSFAGMVNEVADRQLLKWLLPGTNQEAEVQLAIYGACYKLSIFLSLFTQAFRYAGEPFFFAHSRQKEAKQTYALVLKYFTIVSLLGFLTIALFIDLFKHFITDSDYWVGLGIVPILLIAYVFYGMYYNMSIWYKLTDKTILGSVVAVVGALVTIVVNVVFIPNYGYMASAWATFLCFFVMVLISIFWGQKHYPVSYDWKNIFFYVILSIGLFFVFRYFQITSGNVFYINLVLALVGVSFYLLIVGLRERKQLMSLLRN